MTHQPFFFSSVQDVLLKMTGLEGGGDGRTQNLAQFWADDEQLVKVLIGLFNQAESGVRPSPRSPAPLLAAVELRRAMPL